MTEPREKDPRIDSYREMKKKQLEKAQDIQESGPVPEMSSGIQLYGDERSVRSTMLRASKGSTVIVHTSKGPKTMGKLVGYNSDYGQIVVQTEAHSPSSLVVLQLRYVVRLEILQK